MVKLSLPHPIPIMNPTSPFRNFNFMRPIKIVGSDTDLHDYQVRIHLDRSNFPLEKCKPDGSDIRFRDDSGEILPYWIERWNAAEGVIWCKIPFIPAESSKFIWMIYGNPNAQSESNGNAVFELFNVQGVKAFWHFDEPQWTGATGEVRDETGVNHGTAYGGATTTSDAKYGRAGYFDGEDDYVEVLDSDSLDYLPAISLEMWAKSNVNGGQNLVRASGNIFLLHFRGAGFWLTAEDGTGSGYLGWDVSPTFGSLYHFVATWDGEIMKLYINGEKQDSELSFDGGSTGRLGDVQFLTIGKYFNSGQVWFDGTIDEVRIYNRALSPTEIQILSKNYMQKMGSYFNVRKYVTPAPVVIV